MLFDFLVHPRCQIAELLQQIRDLPFAARILPIDDAAADDVGSVFFAKCRHLLQGIFAAHPREREKLSHKQERRLVLKLADPRKIMLQDRGSRSSSNWSGNDQEIVRLRIRIGLQCDVRAVRSRLCFPLRWS